MKNPVGFRLLAGLFATLLLIPIISMVQAFTVLQGSEFQVNSSASGDQDESVVAIDNSGNYIVVWTDHDGLDGDSNGVFFQRYDSTGATVGGETQVNTTNTNNDQDSPAVEMNATGTYVIAWNDGSGANIDIKARLYNSSGTPITGEISVNTTTAGDQLGPSVSMDSSGNFIVTWTDANGADGSGEGIYAQRFDNTGATVGTEFQVNSTTNSDQNAPFVAMSDTGAFVIVWTDTSEDVDPSGDGVLAQLYDNTGTTVGSEFLVNTTITDNQFSSGVGMDSDGDFVVIVRESGAAVFTQPRFQRYNSAGVAQGVETLVDPGSNQNSDRDFMRIDVGPDGDFVVVWTDSDDRDGDGEGVFFRRFDADGTALSEETQANTSTSGDQGGGDVAVSQGGVMVLAWTDGDGEDGDGNGVFGQRVLDVVLGSCEAPAVVGAVTSTYNYYPDDPCGGEMGFPGTCPGNERLGDCPADHILTGIKYYDHDALGPDADRIDGVGTRCTELDETGNLGAHVYDNFYPNDPCGAEMGDCPTEVMGGECPAGFVVTGVNYYSNPNPGSDWTEATGFVCQQLTGGGSVQISLTGRSTNNFYPDDPCGPEMGDCPNAIGSHECQAGSAVIGLQYYEYGSGVGSDNVDGVGVKCAAIEGGGSACGGRRDRDGAGSPIPVGLGDTTTYNYYPNDPCNGEMGLAGTCPGSDRLGDCPTGQVMTGIKYYDHQGNDWIDAVGTVCSVLEEDGRLGNKTYNNFYNGSVCGSEMGACPDSTKMYGGECPAGYVVAGMKYYSNPNPGSDYTEGVGFLCKRIDGGGDTVVSLSGRHLENFYPDQACGPEMGDCPRTIGGIECPGTGVVTGLKYYDYLGTDNVDGVGIKCRQLIGGGGAGLTVLYHQAGGIQSSADLDGDGVFNDQDPDVDGDGIPNAVDDDIDGDGVPNSSDDDDDGDGVPDADDDSSQGFGSMNDVDGDGIPNDQDPDIDGDGIPNVFDDDIDGDGIPNSQDDDDDGDGIFDAVDDSPSGPGSLDDIDGDGIPNAEDSDVDGDGIPNVSDPDIDGDGVLNSGDDDDDGDGVPDTQDSTPQAEGNPGDLDGDGIPNELDSDIDGDGIPNVFDDDIDGDGIPNALDEDDDGDGIPDSIDQSPGGLGSLEDIDGDGIPNTEDPDIDGDGILNAEDDDVDGDGVLNQEDGDIDGDQIVNEDDEEPAGEGSRHEGEETKGAAPASGPVDLPFVPGISEGEVTQELQVLNLVRALQEGFHWMNPAAYQLTSYSAERVKEAQSTLLTRDSFIDVGRALQQQRQLDVFEFVFRLDPVEELQHILDLKKAFVLSLGTLCSTPERLQRSMSFDVEGASDWGQGYREEIGDAFGSFEPGGSQEWDFVQDWPILELYEQVLLNYCEIEI